MKEIKESEITYMQIYFKELHYNVAFKYWLKSCIEYFCIFLVCLILTLQTGYMFESAVMLIWILCFVGYALYIKPDDEYFESIVLDLEDKVEFDIHYDDDIKSYKFEDVKEYGFRYENISKYDGYNILSNVYIKVGEETLVFYCEKDTDLKAFVQIMLVRTDIHPSKVNKFFNKIIFSKEVPML